MMGICSTPWSATCILEGHKFWFCSLCISIFGGLVDFFAWYHVAPAQNLTPPSRNVDDKSPRATESNSDADADAERKQQQQQQQQQSVGAKTRKPQRTPAQILLKIIENAADLIIPGAVTGWIITDAGIIGVATLISTLLSSWEMWRGVGDAKS
ncbi:hypothetical protein DSL72_009157 [Monilinia vaccinii-corymbosi]|uniref:Uncharacterized protein n=1 Tax=Monilinia vaccinii-corymbosi TaxID=61207 RepID=A0A8A3PQA8_9HELO|nr:hypothetical protein DSL72_009157 [Monilinia vaccinii-corymbosi]